MSRRHRRASPAAFFLIWRRVLVGLALSAALAACSSPQQRAQFHYDRGVAFVKDGETAKAAVEFRSALAVDEDMVPALYAMGEIEQAANRLQQAAGYFQRVRELDPSNVDARVRLATILTASGNLDDAARIEDEARILDPNRPDVLILGASLALKSHETDEAIDLANAALKAKPDMPDAYLALAAANLESGKNDAALGFVNQGLASDKGNVGLNLLKVKILGALGDSAGAEEALAKLVSLYPDNQVIGLALVGEYVRAKKLDQAETAFRRILNAHSDDADLALAFVKFLLDYKGKDAARVELVNRSGANAPGGSRFALMLARLDFSDGKVEQAEAELRKLIDAQQPKTSNMLAAQTEFARMLFQSGKTGEAKALVEAVLEADPQRVDALTVRAQMRLKSGDVDGAILDLRSGLAETPRSLPINLILAEAYERRGQGDLAKENLAFVAEELGYDPGATKPYIDFLMRRNEFDRAEKIGNEVLSRHPQSSATIATLASLKLRKGDWEGAKTLAQSLRDRGDDQARISEEITAGALIGEKRFDEGVALLSDLHATDPSAPGPLTSLVQAYVRAGKSDEAETLLRSLLVKHTQDELASTLLALLQPSEGPTQGTAAGAENDVQKTQAASQALAIARFAEGKLDDALRIAEEDLKTDSGNSQLMLLRARVLELKGNAEAAIDAYEEVLKVSPYSTMALNNLASLLSESRNDAKSLERAYELAQRLDPTASPYFQDTLGWIHYLRSENTLALGMLRSAADRLPDVPAVLYHLGVVYAALGQKDLAIENLTRAVDLGGAAGFPQLANARSVLAEITQPLKEGERGEFPTRSPRALPPAIIQSNDQPPQG